MKRKWVALVVLASVATAMLMQGANAAGRPSCLVSNERTGLGSRSLQAGIDAAAAGDTLVVKGTCVGISTVADDLTLRGVSNPAFGVATLDGDHLGSVLTVADGVTVAIANLVVTNGTAMEGGGIANGIGSTVTLIDSNVSENVSTAEGGGVFNRGNNLLTLDNSTVSGNVALAGGGVFSQNGSIVTLNNSIVNRNASNAGGGIFSFNGGGGEVTLNNSTVSGNTAEEEGGGIFFYFETVMLNNSTVTGNTAGYDGGGVYDVIGAFSLVGSSTVNANVAGRDGGGIFSFTGTLINCISGVNVNGNSPNDIYP